MIHLARQSVCSSKAVWKKASSLTAVFPAESSASTLQSTLCRERKGISSGHAACCREEITTPLSHSSSPSSPLATMR